MGISNIHDESVPHPVPIQTTCLPCFSSYSSLPVCDLFHNLLWPAYRRSLPGGYLASRFDTVPFPIYNGCPRTVSSPLESNIVSFSLFWASIINPFAGRSFVAHFLSMTERDEHLADERAPLVTPEQTATNADSPRSANGQSEFDNDGCTKDLSESKSSWYLCMLTLSIGG